MECTRGLQGAGWTGFNQALPAQGIYGNHGLSSSLTVAFNQLGRNTMCVRNPTSGTADTGRNRTVVSSIEAIGSEQKEAGLHTVLLDEDQRGGGCTCTGKHEPNRMEWNGPADVMDGDGTAHGHACTVHVQIAGL
eukprot:scaffold467_cov366-Pavlova_lutheri.AAC.9